MILSVENLSFSYHSTEILKEVNFSLKRGECLALLGTNGAGKSTLLKCLNKILKHKKGTVFVDKHDSKYMNSLSMAKTMAYVAQSNPCNRITVFDAVLIGRRPYIKWDIGEKDIKIVNHVLESMDLDKFALKYVDELSGGEYQKVLLSRALAQEPQILLLDEPTSNLDLKNQLEVLNVVKQISRQNNISAVVTLHDLNLALRFGDKFIFLKDGEIFAAGGKEIITESIIQQVYDVEVKVQEFHKQIVVIPV